MKQYLRKFVMQSSFLIKLANNIRKKILARKHSIIFRQGAYVGLSTLFEGKNYVGKNCSVTSSYLGFGTYIAMGSSFNRTRFGKYCSIGRNVKCIYGKHPSKDFVSTHPAFFSVKHPIKFSYVEQQLFEEQAKPLDKEGNYSIIVGNDVWIGENASIIEGVKIGDGAIVAANALVTKDVSPYSIVGGVPAKEIKKRFTADEIEFLMGLKWWNNSEGWISEHAIFFNKVSHLQKIVSNG